MTSVPRTRFGNYTKASTSGRVIRTSDYYVFGKLNSTTVTRNDASPATPGIMACSDSLQLDLPIQDHDLTIEKKGWTKYPYINGTYISPKQAPYIGYQTKTVYTSYLTGTMRGTTSPSLPVPPSTDWNFLKTWALGDINPMVPVVDIPLFLWELKDFPRMYRDLGRLFWSVPGANRDYMRRINAIRDPSRGTKFDFAKPSDVSGQYLSFKFGWGPLVSDLNNLLNLTSQINKRLEALRDCRLGRSTRGSLFRTRSLLRIQYGEVADSIDSGVYVHLDREAWLDNRAWYTVRLETNDEQALNDLIEHFHSLDGEGKRILGGVSTQNAIGLSTIWESIPWSWLIDYFANIGSYLEAIRGNFPMKARYLCVMNEKVVEESVTGRAPEGIKVDDGVYNHIERLRRVYTDPSPTIFFRGNLLQPQLNILSALTTARVLKRAGL